ncbi:MAG: NUDIX hydrolase [Eggerthellaceae bacterium]|nr:NUDIX hydrolase [Eggerthellaceae bacterium]
MFSDKNNNQSVRPEFLGLEVMHDSFLKTCKLTFRQPDGTEHPYLAISRKSASAYEQALRERSSSSAASDAVAVVGLTKEGNILLTREFRYPINDYCIQFPAGLREAGETPIEAGSRELLEETGYDYIRTPEGKPLQAWCFPQPGFSSLGMTNENIDMVFALVEKVAQPQPEAIEHIESFEVPAHKAGEFLLANTEAISIRAQLVLGMHAFGFAGPNGLDK